MWFYGPVESLLTGGSYVDPLLRVEVQIPAGAESKVREQGVNASLALRVEEEVLLAFPVLVRHCVIGPDCDCPINIAMPQDPEAKEKIVACIERRQ